MNDFIKAYNEIFRENGCVHINSCDLRISNRITILLQKYNEASIPKERIPKKLSFKDKLEKIRTIKTESPITKELRSLFEFKCECEALSPRINENDLNGKMKYIKQIIEENNKTASVQILDKKILYDEKIICIEKIDSISKFSQKLKEYNLSTDFYYRGQQNLNWSVKPSIFRNNWINHEKEFIEEMLINNPHDFDNANTTLDKLTKMQHYGAPTRLLDLTRNPYIALYFACEKTGNLDKKTYGEVVFFKKQNENSEKFFDSDAVSIVSNLAMMKSNFCIGNKNLSIEEFNKQKNTDIPYLLHQIKQEKPQFLDIINPTDLHKCFIVHVKLENKRIINQQGLFLLVGMGQEKIEPADINVNIYKNESKRLIFVIPENKKKEILDQLDTMNINKKFIYPEIDDVADYLKNEKFRDY